MLYYSRSIYNIKKRSNNLIWSSKKDYLEIIVLPFNPLKEIESKYTRNNRFLISPLRFFEQRNFPPGIVILFTITVARYRKSIERPSEAVERIGGRRCTLEGSWRDDKFVIANLYNWHGGSSAYPPLGTDEFMANVPPSCPCVFPSVSRSPVEKK